MYRFMTPTLSEGYYKITYNKNGFVQYKHLVSEYNYHTIYKPLISWITDLEIAANKKNGQNKIEISAIKKAVKEMFGDNWFLDVSPLFDAIETGVIILPPHQGGEHKCKIEKL